MISPRDKLEPRGTNDPKFNPKNNVDRKIMLVVTISVAIFTLLAIGCFLIYFLVLKK